MLVLPIGWIPPIAPWRSPTPPSGWVLTTQWACSSKATTPISSRAVIAAAARRIASLPMSTLRTPDIPAPGPPAPPPSNELQWQASIEPGLVDHDDERDVGLLLAVPDAHVDRQRLLDRRLRVAAGAVRVRAADHHEALAEVADEDLEGEHLAVRERRPRDVDQDDGVVRGEHQRIAREARCRDRVDVLPLGLERADELGRDDLVAGHDQRARLALDDRVGVGPVVLAERVESSLDDDAEPQEAGLLGLDPERDVGRPRFELDLLDPDLDAVREQAHRRRLVCRRADLRRDLDLLAEARRRWRRDPLDEDLLGRPEADRLGLDLDPARRGECRLRLALAGRVVAVREQDDPLLGVVREQRRGQPEGRADVRGGGDRRRCDAVDVAQLCRQPLDERSLAERDDPCDVALGHDLEAVADERKGVLAAGLADAVRQVDDEHRREPIDGQHEPEARQARSTSADRSRVRTTRATRRRPLPVRRRAPRCSANVSSSAGTSSSSASGASNAMPMSGAPPVGAAEPAGQVAPAADDHVAVVEAPLHAEANEHEKDNRQPQLIAGRRPIRRGVRAPEMHRARRRARPGGRASRDRTPCRARSTTPRRRTSRPRTGSGPSGRCRPTAGPPWLAEGDGRGVGLGEAPGEDAGPSGNTGVAVYTPSRSVWVNVTAPAPAVPGARSTTEPSGRSTRSPVAPPWSGSDTGSPGVSASVGAALPPISSPVRFAIRIGNATWSGRSLFRGSKARTALGTLARTPA